MQLQPSRSSACLAIHQFEQLIKYSAVTRRKLSLKAEKLLQQSKSSLILRLVMRGERKKKLQIRCSHKLLDIFHTPVQQERTCNHKVTECKISWYSCVSDDNYRNWGKNPTAFINVPAKHVSTWIQASHSPSAQE